MCEMSPEHCNLSSFNGQLELNRLALRLAAGKLRLSYRGHPLSAEAVEHAVSKAGECLALDPARFASRTHLLNFLRLAAGRKAMSERRGPRGRCQFLADRAEGVADPRSAADKERGRSSETVEALFSSLRGLASAERELIVDYYLNGLTDGEIGARLYGSGPTRSASGQRVRKRRLLSLARLRRLLTEAGVGPDA
jgi:DNA-directed RNA polymerase specialized sigma24 family protein